MIMKSCKGICQLPNDNNARHEGNYCVSCKMWYEPKLGKYCPCCKQQARQTLCKHTPP